MAVTTARDGLLDTNGFIVESADGDVGWVEEVWLGKGDEPRALAVETVDGRHALLSAEDVLAVDREQHWVVIPPDQELLELDAPRLTAGNGRAGMRLVASWGTTGSVLPAPSRPRWRSPIKRPERHRRPQPAPAASPREGPERPLWQAVILLYGSLALFAVLLITLAFLVARLVTGAAY
jgi:hypothetical protein